jgi:hypothetical protein
VRRPTKATRALAEYPRIDRFGRIDKGKGKMVCNDDWVGGRPFRGELAPARKMEGPRMMNHASSGKTWNHGVA